MSAYSLFIGKRMRERESFRTSFPFPQFLPIPSFRVKSWPLPTSPSSGERGHMAGGKQSNLEIMQPSTLNPESRRRWSDKWSNDMIQVQFIPPHHTPQQTGSPASCLGHIAGWNSLSLSTPHILTEDSWVNLGIMTFPCKRARFHSNPRQTWNIKHSRSGRPVAWGHGHDIVPRRLQEGYIFL